MPLRWTPIMFLAATAIGVVMRGAMMGGPLPLPFDHLLHAHSHVLYFGWGGLALLAMAARDGAPRRAAIAGAWLVPVMGVTFLLQGYGPASIAASTAVMLAWYVAILTWWRRPDADRWFRCALGYVLVASVGVWVLAPLQMLAVGGLPEALAVHAFLSAFAWSLVLGTMAIARRNALVPAPITRRIMIWSAALAWLLFPLGVAGGPEVPVLGWLSRLAAVALAVPMTIWVRRLWLGGPPTVRAAAVWLAVAVGGLVTVAVGGNEVLSATGRPGVVFYLHALLLGYVTTVVAWDLSRRAGSTVSFALAAHHAGVAVMLAGIAAPLAGLSATTGNQVATAGAVVVWLAGWAWGPAVWRAR